MKNQRGYILQFGWSPLGRCWSFTRTPDLAYPAKRTRKQAIRARRVERHELLVKCQKQVADILADLALLTEIEFFLLP